MNDELRTAVLADVDRFRSVWVRRRLRLYRQFLQVTVTTATPLLSRVIGPDRAGLDRLLWTLRPPPDWPGAPPQAAVPRHGRFHQDLSAADRARVRVLVMREEGHPDGRLALRIMKRSVDISCEVGGHPVRTFSGMTYLRLPLRLPDVVAAASLGRPLMDVVRHPWLDSSDWRIRKVRSNAHETWISVHTGREAFEMPWSRLLPEAARID
ncbi:hypothetical protein AVM11_16410 [Sphingomonas melonis TY]|jgi:hypothetical protein|uniref:Uncharacterized protein n=1 Tax=Sphingomonas melonis TY TaxID=621456 RepID=A0A175Y5X3_9SPHN|nr:hypothetical protein [Sphingomonas melonis]AOW25308.1 hypothetical protein BJP26_18620 [Sphingomonas melonis TY]KZB95779.1 hypothetical protein AVM11_16410 [Sphingomonas melonis TY]